MLYDAIVQFFKIYLKIDYQVFFALRSKSIATAKSVTLLGFQTDNRLILLFVKEDIPVKIINKSLLKDFEGSFFCRIKSSRKSFCVVPISHIKEMLQII